MTLKDFFLPDCFLPPPGFLPPLPPPALLLSCLARFLASFALLLTCSLCSLDCHCSPKVNPNVP